jgi:hypothetical protein
MSSFNGQYFMAGLLLAIAMLVIVASGQSGGPGCKSRGLCCQGKNNTCRSTRLDNIKVPVRKTKLKVKEGERVTPLPDDDDDRKTHNDKSDENNDKAKSKSCFCDSACLDLGDCCEDYKNFCKPVDCIVAPKWGDWGACDARCGPGVKQRTRKVTRAPLNGGKPCEPTVEKIPCEGGNCKVARAPEGFEQLGETGKIIPASYGTWRKSKVYDPFSDIRRNLFDHYRAKQIATRPSYCTKFELTEVQSPCNVTSEKWPVVLTNGSSICVECQTLAMHRELGGRCIGQGVLLRETRWNAVLRAGCHGKWVMQSRQENCRCDADSSASFILL